VSLALGIYATLATIACAVCALGWRWQTRLTDRVLDIADEAQEHAMSALAREHELLCMLRRHAPAEVPSERADHCDVMSPGGIIHIEEHALTAEKIAAAERAGYRVISRPGAAVRVEEHVFTAEERAGLDCGGLFDANGGARG
jgi:hypothetical protein